MSVHIHTLSATLAGYGAISPKRAQITLDDRWSPYAQASMTLPVPSSGAEPLLTALDPRSGTPPKVTIVAGRSGDTPTQSRTYILSVRGRKRSHDGREVVVELASAEALLQDYGLVAAAVANPGGTSARAAIEYALNKIGASLNDEVITNLATNPSSETNATNWGSFAGTGGAGTQTRPGTGGKYGTSFERFTWTTATSGPGPGNTYRQNGLTPGQQYTVSLWVRCSKIQRVNLGLEFYNASNVYLGGANGAQVVLAANVWTQITVTGTAPAGTSYGNVAPYSIAGTSYSNWAVGNTYDADGLTFVVGAVVYDFDGATADTSTYDYGWSGTANASTSTRRTIMPDAVATTTSLDWPPGVSAWDYITPIAQAANLRLWSDELGVWRFESADIIQDGSVNISDATNATKADDEISRDGEWYDSVVIVYKSVVAGATVLEYDIAGAPGTKTLRLQYDRPKPGTGAAANVLARMKGRGRVLDLKAISDYTARPGQPIVATMSDTAIQTGLVKSVQWEFPGLEMRVATRELVDTPSSAWMFLAPGVDWLASPVGQSWIAEIV